MTVILRNLRDRIAQLEGFSPPRLARTCPTGWPAIDAALPGGGLLQGALHEIHAPDPADGAATGFAFRLMSRFLAAMPAAVVWASCRCDLFAPGLKAAGVDPSRLLVARCRTSSDVLFTIEESCKFNDIKFLSADLGDVDFSLSRRLQLAAAETGTTLLLLRPARFEAAPSAAVTRWHAKAQPGGWSLTLFRSRGGRLGHWLVSGMSAKAPGKSMNVHESV